MNRAKKTAKRERGRSTDKVLQNDQALAASNLNEQVATNTHQARSALEDYLPPQCEVAMEMAEEARAGAHEGTLACDHQLHDATLPSTILTDEIRERLCEERAAISRRG